MIEALDKIPAWVYVLVIPALLAAFGVVAKKTKNKVDDWAVSIATAAFGRLIGAHPELLEGPDDEDTDPAKPRASIQLGENEGAPK